MIKKTILFSFVVFSLIRFYFLLTDGFLIGNITSDFAFDSRFETRALTGSEKELVDRILDQPFHYLGKGCQSYVFASQDGEYVLKFFKYQRYRKGWGDYLAFLPFVREVRERRWGQKKEKLERLFLSWRIAFDHLQQETGLVYMHLNKTKGLHSPLLITDKMGFKHLLHLDSLEFMVQKRAKMLGPALTELMQRGEREGAKRLVQAVHALMVSEYERGFADEDPALLQNTGVIAGLPIHVDVGQFVEGEQFKDPACYREHLKRRMGEMNRWIEASYPELATDF